MLLVLAYENNRPECSVGTLNRCWGGGGHERVRRSPFFVSGWCLLCFVFCFTSVYSKGLVWCPVCLVLCVVNRHRRMTTYRTFPIVIITAVIVLLDKIMCGFVWKVRFDVSFVVWSL